MEYMIEYMRVLLNGLNVDKRAVTALEYGMIAALVAVVVITAFKTLGTNLNSTISSIAASIN
ncbi:MAG TPA: Flp family type IVb pilin [Rhodopila sp.]|nr:Flp family type IVb pilin [Rhodopila sp.]